MRNPWNCNAGVGYGFTLQDESQERLSLEDLIVCLNGKTSLPTVAVTRFLRTILPMAS